MKIRQGFVSNSSSSSFVIRGMSFGVEELSRILKIEESDVVSFLGKRGFETQYGGNCFGNPDYQRLIIGDALQDLEDGEFVEFEDDPNNDFKLLERFEKIGIVGTLKTYVQMISNDNY